MGKITINRGQGGLGAEPVSQDHISGFVFQNATALSVGAVQKVFSLEEAETAGLVLATYPVEHYHVQQYFAMREKITGLAQGEFYFMVKNITALAYDGTEIQVIQDSSEGRIRQVAVYLDDPYLAQMVSDSQTKATAVETDNKPLSVLLAADFSAIDSSALADSRTLAAKNVSLIIGEDGAALGKELRTSEAKSITNIGAALGCASAAAVNENLGWRQKFEITNGTNLAAGTRVTENETLALATSDGTTIPNTAALDLLTTNGYMFAVKEVGFTGTFFNNAPVSALLTNDFFSLERVRTIDKASRLVRINLIPKINSPLFINATTGKLSQATIEDFKNEAFRALETMAINQEVSTDENGALPANTVTIDPDQDVLTTSKIELAIRIVPVGVAREIVVNISFAKSV